ncbi:hypothetical protein Tco_0363164 [Tanacetum coccineum]
MGEGSANPIDPHHTPTITQSSTQPQKTQKPRKPKRKDTHVPQPSDPSDNVADEVVHKELGDSLVRAATTASSLEVKQDSGGGPRCQETMGDTITQTRFENVSKLSNDSLLARVLDFEKTKTTKANEIASLKRRVKKLKKKRSSRTHKLKRLYKVGLSDRVESSRDEEDLVNVQDDADNEMFDVDALNGITLDQALEALKTSKPKVKGIVFQEPEPVKPMKKKDQISFDEEVTLKLQAKFDKERLAREKAKKEKEANVA